MQWSLIYHDEFAAWLSAQEEKLQDETLAYLEMLKDRGPLLGRPYVDTLKGSSLPNLKELRFEYERAPIRLLFAFDPKRQAVILLGGNKQTDKRWYERNIPIAEKRFKQHLDVLSKIKKRKSGK
jgi:hypothetical protein